MNPWFVLFIVVDILVTLGVVLFIMNRRMARNAQGEAAGSILGDLRQMGALVEFTKERHGRIADYVRANWSGEPSQLGGVLTSLVDQLESEARAQGHTFSRELLKTVVATSLREQKVARPEQVGVALEQVA